MSKTQFLNVEGSKDCKRAVLPIVLQEAEVIFNTALDGIAPTVIGPVAAADPLFYGGSFTNKGCTDLQVDITYYAGDDCDACTAPDALIATVIPWVIPANSITEIPEGFWGQISYVLANAASDSKVQKVSFNSCYTPGCSDCIVVAP